MTDQPTVAETLTRQQIGQVDALIRAAFAVDGVAALNEDSSLRLHDPNATDSLHVRATRSDELVGYAIAEDAVDAVSFECVVHPEHRRQGIASGLVETLLARAGQRPVRAWAHGDLPGSAALADRYGFERVRVLLKMRADLGSAVNAAAPDGVTIRTFRPGADDAAWLELNARAFAAHPEQGAMTQHDLDLRKQSAWFDPEGFFVAERAGELVGFHWTKVHDDDPGGPVGEVYVVGVDPSAQGSGLGSVLTRRGLTYLRERGLRTVELYVEGDNAPALAVYGRLGFVEAARDVMYARRDA